MQAASTESVVNGVEPRGALPMPPTDSGETDSNCGAREGRAVKQRRGAVCVVCVGGRAPRTPSPCPSPFQSSRPRPRQSPP